MPDKLKREGFLNLKTSIQLIAGILFIFVGVCIMVRTFDNNYILRGSTKYWFGGILCLYGIVRIARIYFNWNTQKED